MAEPSQLEGGVMKLQAYSIYGREAIVLCIPLQGGRGRHVVRIFQRRKFRPSLTFACLLRGRTVV